MPDAVRALGGPMHGYPSIQTAVLFVVVSVMLLVGTGSSCRCRVTDVLALVIVVVAYMTFISYTYDLTFFMSPPHTGMGLHAAIGFMLLAFARIFRADGLVATVATESPGGLILRRYLTIGLVTPVLLGWLRILAQNMGLIDTPEGIALMVLALTVMTTYFLFWNAVSINRLAEVQRRASAEIALRTAELAQAQELARQKDAFLSTLSHEIKTPLAIILGNAELLSEAYPPEPMLTGLMDGTQRLNDHISRLLDYNAAMSGSMRLYETTASRTCDRSDRTHRSSV